MSVADTQETEQRETSGEFARSAHIPATDVDLIPRIVADARRHFDSGATRSYAWRVAQLEGILHLLTENEDAILAALADDLGKPRYEGVMSETGFLVSEVRHALKHLRRWMKPRRVGTPLAVMPGRSEVHSDPLGVVLIIAPWNYPLQLLAAPLVGALAAGNCAILKPSEVAPATSELIAALFPRYVDASAVRVVEGGVPETTKLLEQRFDHIFYTGNGKVGRVVMRAAAEHLTPVTLELGGKSPVYIDPSADLDEAAKRLVWGKFFNCGQTCIAPDYILAHESIHDAFVAKLVDRVRQFYGDDAQRSRDYGRIINERHLRRLETLLESGRIEVGGETDPSDRFIAPTVLSGVSPDSPVMADEIFGPILPVLSTTGVEDAIRFITARPKPLAMYIFARDKPVIERLLAETSAGGVVTNHIWHHYGVPDLPFGGVGESGMGAYHGQQTFDLFSHQKAVMRKPATLDVPVTYPPYTDAKTELLKKVL